MKKSLLLIIAAVFSIGTFSSCEKDYTCACERKGTYANTTITKITASARIKAKSECEQNNNKTAIADGYHCILQ